MSKWSLFAQIAKALVPQVITVLNPKLAPLANTIADGIATAQEIPGLSGADKLAHVQSLAHETAIGINQAAGHEVVPVQGLDDATAHVINASVQVVKDLHPKVVDAPVQ